MFGFVLLVETQLFDYFYCYCYCYSIYYCCCYLSDEKGCSYCGGLGHRITECPKLEAIQMKETGRIGKKDYLAGSSADW